MLLGDGVTKLNTTGVFARARSSIRDAGDAVRMLLSARPLLFPLRKLPMCELFVDNYNTICCEHITEQYDAGLLGTTFSMPADQPFYFTCSTVFCDLGE